MRDKILQTLKEFEVKEQGKILFAAEFGSRVWGFASSDSDYDIRVVYGKNEELYWNNNENKQILLMKCYQMICSGWKLKKSFTTFLKCNLALNDWLNSLIIYYAEKRIFSK